MKIFKNILTVIIIIGLLVWGGITLVKNKRISEEETRFVAMQNDSVAVNVAQVSYQQIQTEYIANGIFRAEQELEITSEIPGKVIRVMVEEGEKVKQGQTLAVIRGEAQSIDLGAAEASYQNAFRDNQRMEKALETGGVTQQQVDMSRLQLKSAKSQLEQAQLRVGDTQVKSSIEGVINMKMIEPGSFVSPGVPMFEVVNVSGLKLRVEVDENQVANFKTGDSVKVKAGVYPDKEFFGKISFVASKATASLNFPVEIKLDNQQNLLKAGMYGTAFFSSAQREGKIEPALVIPREAFVGGLNNAEVFVLDNDNSVHLQKVVIGRIFGDQVEILQGLTQDQTVVTGGQINLTDGALVRIIQ